jgi:ribosomal protein S18 acetylase RimI-like enzyme
VPWTTAELPALRSRLGESAALWARDVVIEPGRWKAFSGAFSPRYNLALCHGQGVLAATADEIARGRVPAIVMVAGGARDEVDQLDGWACLGEMPFMARAAGAPPAPGARRLAGGEIDGARELMAEVFDLHDRLALLALPPDTADKPGQSVWGALDEDGALTACVVTVQTGEFVAIWSLATAPERRRQGHATRAMRAALAGTGRPSLLYTPVTAEPFYRALGYEGLERWQLWTRRRWINQLPV